MTGLRKRKMPGGSETSVTDWSEMALVQRITGSSCGHSVSAVPAFTTFSFSFIHTHTHTHTHTNIYTYLFYFIFLWHT